MAKTSGFKSRLLRARAYLLRDFDLEIGLIYPSVEDRFDFIGDIRGERVHFSDFNC